MSDYSSLLEDGREAALDTLAQHLRLIHELKRRPEAKAETLPPPSNATGAPDPGLHDLVFDLARLSLHSYNQWLKISSTHFDSIVQQLRGMTGVHAPQSPLEPRIVVEISGKPGDSVTSAPFRVANPFSVPVDVSFASPEFCGLADWEKEEARRFHAPIEYLREGPPPHKVRPGLAVHLAPGESATFRVQIHLRPALTGEKDSATGFETGKQYMGEAYVLSKGRVAGVLRVKVTAQ